MLMSDRISGKNAKETVRIDAGQDVRIDCQNRMSHRMPNLCQKKKYILPDGMSKPISKQFSTVVITGKEAKYLCTVLSLGNYLVAQTTSSILASLKSSHK